MGVVAYAKDLPARAGEPAPRHSKLRQRATSRQGKTNEELAPKLIKNSLQTVKRVLILIGKPAYFLISATIIIFLFVTYWLGRLTRISSTRLLSGIAKLLFEFMLSVLYFPVLIYQFVKTKLKLLKLPKISLPKISIPEVRPPKIQPPIVRLPKVTLPEIILPEISLPKIKVPKLEFKLPPTKKPLNLFYLKLKLKLISLSQVKITLPELKFKPLLAIFFFGFLLVSFFFWWFIFRDLPSPSELVARDLEVSTKIYDRNGKLLYKIYKDQNRTLVPLEEIPRQVQLATIAIEDAEFYQHPGFSVRGILRAFIKNVLEGELSGGSTITQQLVKNALLSSEKTLTRKLREIVLAVSTEFTYNKDQILEMYLNEVPYGGTAYGIQEASRVYFGKNVSKLSLAEAALLAGLPKSPTRYSPFGSNPELALARQKEVLNLMVINKFITKDQAENALAEKIVFAPNKTEIEAPHFVMYVRETLAQKYGEEVVETGGLEVVTTLDYSIQLLAEKIVKEEIEKLARLNVTNGAVLVINPTSGEILAMVGSKDYFDQASDGNVNVTTRPRQPGSAIKVINYSYALSNGYTPASILADTPVTFSVPGQPPYSPRNYDSRFRGRLPLRNALAESRNVPAVKVLASYGVDKMIDLGREMGITTWNNSSRFGLSLTLGGGEVKLIDLARVYATIANYGKRPEFSSILKITNYKGKMIDGYKCFSEQVTKPNLAFKLTSLVYAAEAGKDTACLEKQVVDPRVAFMLIDILADNNARAPAFGSYSQLVIPGHDEVAVKTGTSNNLRDNLTLGFNQNYLVAVWVGNNDNSPMARVASGVTGASPIFNRIMSALLSKEENHSWPVPDGLVQAPICILTGTLTCEGCPTRMEWFLKENMPKTACKPEYIKSRIEAPSVTPILRPPPRDGIIFEPAIRIER